MNDPTTPYDPKTLPHWTCRSRVADAVPCGHRNPGARTTCSRCGAENRSHERALGAAPFAHAPRCREGKHDQCNGAVSVAATREDCACACHVINRTEGRAR